MPPSNGLPRHETVGDIQVRPGMSPGPTFDRVYLALKVQLRIGRYPPGTHLEPAQLTQELCSSITPIRDALHRLVGERLVEAPLSDGFRVPMVTELGLRRLYRWQAELLRLAIARYPSGGRDGDTQAGQRDDGASAPAPDVFVELARATGDLELVAALANSCDRLAAVRLMEERFIPSLATAFEGFRAMIEAHELAALRRALATYQRQRDRAVPQIVGALQRDF